MCDFDSGYDGGSDIGGSFESDVSVENTSDVSLDSEIETLDVDGDTVSEVSDTEIELLDVDDEATDTTIDKEEIDEAFFDEFSLDELDDGRYHATHLSEEEVQQIDEMWQEKNSVADVEPYQAQRLSEDEIARINELNENKVIDVEPYHAIPNDLDIISEADADRFAAEIEALTLDELEVEQERLDKLHNDAEMDIFGEYDASVKGSLSEEQYHDLVDGLPKETLEHLRSGLENRDKDVLDYFGLGSADEDSDNPEELTLKRSK